MIKKCLVVSVILSVSAAVMAQEAPLGSVEQPTKQEAKALADLKGKVSG
jgi:hypothetical protein